MTSIGTSILQLMPFKSMCVVLLFIPIIIIYRNVVMANTELCSSWFPDYAVILDMPITLTDGSILSENQLYPPAAMWYKNSLAFGCPCNIKPCIRPCCPNGAERYGMICVYSKSTVENKSTHLKVSSSKDIEQVVNVKNNHYSFLKYNCILSYHSEARLLDNGSVWDHESGMKDSKEFCFDIEENRLIGDRAFYCLQGHLENSQIIAKMNTVIMSSLLILLFVIHLISLTVYAVLPHLRGGHGKAIISYVAMLAIRAILLLIHTTKFYIAPTLTNEITRVAVCFEEAAHLWQLYIMWNMCHAFHTQLIPGPRPNTTSFIVFTVLTWASILLFSILSLKIHVLPVQVALFLTNLAATKLCIVMLVHLRRIRIESLALACENSKKHNAKEVQWQRLVKEARSLTAQLTQSRSDYWGNLIAAESMNIFLKICLISGVDYMIYTTTGIYIEIKGLSKNFSEESNLYMFIVLIIGNFNYLKGVEIFFLFVLKKSTWNGIRKVICRR